MGPSSVGSSPVGPSRVGPSAAERSRAGRSPDRPVGRSPPVPAVLSVPVAMLPLAATSLPAGSTPGRPAAQRPMASSVQARRPQAARRSPRTSPGRSQWARRTARGLPNRAGPRRDRMQRALRRQHLRCRPEHRCRRWSSPARRRRREQMVEGPVRGPSGSSTRHNRPRRHRAASCATERDDAASGSKALHSSMPTDPPRTEVRHVRSRRGHRTPRGRGAHDRSIRSGSAFHSDTCRHRPIGRAT